MVPLKCKRPEWCAVHSTGMSAITQDWNYNEEIVWALSRQSHWRLSGILTNSVVGEYFQLAAAFTHLQSSKLQHPPCWSFFLVSTIAGRPRKHTVLPWRRPQSHVHIQLTSYKHRHESEVRLLAISSASEAVSQTLWGWHQGPSVLPLSHPSGQAAVTFHLKQRPSWVLIN